jgi:P27 family predicted phage terminase small subunit
MGERGPAPTPTNILHMRGTYRPDRHGGVEPSGPLLDVAPPAPSYLRSLATEIWDAKAALLVELKLLTAGDLASLEGYCVAHERAIEAEAVVALQGRTVLTAQGIKRHPELITAEKARADMRRYEQEFGLTPSARTRLRQPAPTKPPASNPFGAVADAAAPRKPA